MSSPWFNSQARLAVRRAAFLLLSFTTVASPAVRVAAHGGGILIHELDGGLVTGLNDPLSSTITMGLRSFAGHLPSFNAWNDPGFHSLSPAPSGYGQLPFSTEISWDFLPMNVDGVTSNLLYWDGVGETPQFGLPEQSGTTMTLIGRNNQLAAADGTAEMIPGKVLERTLASVSGALTLHAHQYWSLEVAGGAAPVEGFYLTALQVRMGGYTTSPPFYVTWGTLNVSLETLNDVVVPWAEDQADDLIRPGDFDFDGGVDGRDLLLWQRQLGLAGPFPIDGAKTDGDGDNAVAASDLAIWTENFGRGGDASLQRAVSSAVPEPSAVALAILAFSPVRSRFRMSYCRRQLRLLGCDAA